MVILKWNMEHPNTCRPTLVPSDPRLSGHRYKVICQRDVEYCLWRRGWLLSDMFLLPPGEHHFLSRDYSASAKQNMSLMFGSARR